MGLPGDAVIGACFDKAGGGFLVAGALPLLDVVALGAAVVAVGNARSSDVRVAALGSSRPNGGGGTKATGSISCSN